jgi:hypothetical protein
MVQSTLSKSRNPVKRPTLSAVNAAPEAKSFDSLQGYEVLFCLLRGEGAHRSYWGFPARGGYSGGCTTGAAAAMAYLKYLRVNPEARQFGGLLQNIAMDMLSERSTEIGPRASESLRGQAVGFFSTINKVLEQCVAMLDNLDAHSFESLLGDVDRGLARTKADDEARSSRAKEVSELRDFSERVAVRGAVRS